MHRGRHIGPWRSHEAATKGTRGGEADCMQDAIDLLEVFTDSGIGTMVLPEEVRG